MTARRALWASMLAPLLVAMVAAWGHRASGQVSVGGVDVERDITYGQAGGQDLVMDVYLPKGQQRSPVVVMIHGGGFVGGNRDLNTQLSASLAQQGFAVFNLDYRLAPRFPYPSAVKDVETAVRFIRDHAGDYRIDPARIALFGTSAGGTIASSVGAQGKGTTGSRVAAIVAWSSTFDMQLNVQLRPRNPMVQEGLSGYIGMPGTDLTSPAAQAKLAQASPINQVKGTFPPIFIANATEEFLPIDIPQKFMAKLKSLKVTYRFFTPGNPHAHALHYRREAEAPSVAFLDKYLVHAALDGPTPASPTHGPTSTGPEAVPDQPADRSSVLLPILVGAGILLIAGLLGSTWLRNRRLRSRL